MRRFWIVLCSLVLVLAGCQEGEPVASPTTTIALPTAAPTAETTPTVATPEPESPRFTLGVWVPPTISSAEALSEQLLSFAETHPDVTLDLQTKSVSEQGGILSYLRTGRTIAPSVLPDLIALPSDQLQTAVRDGLVFPLTDLDVSGTYPAGQAFGRVNNTQYGYPFLISDFYHLVYNPNIITGDFADRWADFAQLERAQIILPANGMAGANLLLQLYASEGGSLADSETAFQLQAPPLTEALTMLETGAISGFLMSQSAAIVEPAEAWNLFQSGNATIIYTSAESFLTRRAEGNGSSFAPLPGDSGGARPVVHGWVWAITTPNVERQALAAELIAHFTTPQNLSALSTELMIPPASAAGFLDWQINEYTSFLQTELANAVAYPNTLNANGINALAAATTAILVRQGTVQETAEQLNAALQPR